MTTTQMASEPETNGSDDGGTHRDRQRAALRELLELASQCAAEESEIDRRRQTELDGAKRQYDKGTTVLMQRLQSEAATMAQRHEASCAAIENKHGVDSATLKNAEAKSRQKIESGHEPVVRKIKEKLAQDIWLADSVFEVSQNQVKAELKKAKSANRKLIDALDEMEKQAKELMAKYHLSAPPVPQCRAGSAGGCSEAAFKQGADGTEQQVTALAAFDCAESFRRLAVHGGSDAGHPGGSGHVLRRGQRDHGRGNRLWRGRGAGAILAVLLFMLAGKQARRAYPAFVATMRRRGRSPPSDWSRITTEQDKKLKRPPLIAAKPRSPPPRTKWPRCLTNAEKQKLADLASIDGRCSTRVRGCFRRRRRPGPTPSPRSRPRRRSCPSGKPAKSSGTRTNTRRRCATPKPVMPEARRGLEAKWSDGFGPDRRADGPIRGNSDLPGVDGPELAEVDTSQGVSTSGAFWRVAGRSEKDRRLLAARQAVHAASAWQFLLPAMLTYPQHASLLIEASRDSREEAIRMLQMTMMRPGPACRRTRPLHHYRSRRPGKEFRRLHAPGRPR